jgi:hypothetical protein
MPGNARVAVPYEAAGVTAGLSTVEAASEMARQSARIETGTIRCFSHP